MNFVCLLLEPVIFKLEKQYTDFNQQYVLISLILAQTDAWVWVGIERYVVCGGI